MSEKIANRGGKDEDTEVSICVIDLFVLNAAPRPPTSPGATTCGATCQECNIKFGMGGRGVNELQAVALPKKIVEISLLIQN